MQKYKVVLIALVAATVGFFTAQALIVHRTPKLPAFPRTVPAKKIVMAPAQTTPASEQASVSHETAPQLAIVLDDWGNNYSLLKEVQALNRPITIAILPHQAHSRQISEDACKSGLEVILHMPMQPKNQKVGLEPHLLTTETSDKDIVKFTDAALANVGACVEGVNNHMGSAATSDKRVMHTLLSHLKQKGFFFFDSFVISTSAGPQVAQEVGIPFAKRDVFIDNVVEVEAIKQELREAEKIAKKRGHAIVIGHDKAPTVEAIRQMIPELEKNGIRIVPLKTFIKKS